MKKIQELFDKCEQLKKDREKAILELKESKELLSLEDKIPFTVEKRIEELKNSDFDKAFEIWKKYSDKKRCYSIGFFDEKINGKNIWEFVKVTPSNEKEYYLDYIGSEYCLDDILSNLKHSELIDEEILEFKKLLMDKNIGSFMF